jgi:hypothetical protein
MQPMIAKVGMKPPITPKMISWILVFLSSLCVAVQEVVNAGGAVGEGLVVLDGGAQTEDGDHTGGSDHTGVGVGVHTDRSDHAGVGVHTGAGYHTGVEVATSHWRSWRASEVSDEAIGGVPVEMATVVTFPRSTVGSGSGMADTSFKSARCANALTAREYCIMIVLRINTIAIF